MKYVMNVPEPGCGWELLGDADPGKVEEGDGENGAAEGERQLRVVRQLVHTVVRVLQHHPTLTIKSRDAVVPIHDILEWIRI